MQSGLVRYSKFLSLILRHKPATVGLKLDDGGWVDVDTLLAAIQQKKPGFTREVLEEVVATNNKKRFAFSEDGSRIRASQGHSIGVDLGLQATAPPAVLYHGTADRNLDSIRQKGLIRGRRDHVHLSAEQETARNVGQRHGQPVVLTVHSARMVKVGYTFFLSANGVWLTHSVPSAFIGFPGE